MAKDYLMDDDDDMLIENGDLAFGPSEEQEIYQIMDSNPGEWKESPLTGFGYVRRIKAEQSDEDLKKDLDTQLRLDGFKDVEIEVKNGVVNILKARR